MASYKTWSDFDVEDDFVLPEGDVLRGQLLFKKHCSQCHTIRRDGINPYGTLWGPNLYGVMGRTAAQNQRTSGMKYSRALEESGILWTEKNMMLFLKNPRMFAGGVINMNFRGIDSFQDRVDIIHYIKRAGHESWMLRDGTPHTQRAWWTRQGASGRTEYRQLHSDDKDLKPYQHLQRAISKRFSETYQSALAGFGIQESQGAAAGSTDIVNFLQNNAPQGDVDVETWRRVQRVEDGVKAASQQQSFNWPPPEIIAEGPKKVSGPRKSKGAQALESVPGVAVSQGVATSAAPSLDLGLIAPTAVLVCEGTPAPAPREGFRAPSGIMVYPDTGGPAASAAGSPAGAATAAAAVARARGAAVAPTAAMSPPLGESRAPSGLLVFADVGGPAASTPLAPPAPPASGSKL